MSKTKTIKNPWIYDKDPPLWKWVEISQNKGYFKAMAIPDPFYKLGSFYYMDEDGYKYLAKETPWRKIVKEVNMS